MAEQPPETEETPVVHPGDIIQIIDETAPWFLCLLVVEEVRKWGVQAYAMVPGVGASALCYQRCATGTFAVCGAAAMLTQTVIEARQLSIDTHAALAAEAAKS